MTRLVLRGGCVLTLAERTPNFPRADVVVDNGVVSEIGENLRVRDAEAIDATDAIVMPGFVDAHRHGVMSLFRNLGDAGSAIEATHLTPDDVYAATLISLLGAVEAGITSVVDWVDIGDDPDRLDAAAQASADSGVRTVIAAVTGPDAGLATVTDRIGDGLVTPAFGSPPLSTQSGDVVQRTWSAARETGLRIHAHAGIEPAAAGSVAELGAAGLLGDDVTLVHGTHLDHADLDAVAGHGAHIVTAPSSEMAGGLGVPPLQEFLDRKIEPGLGVGDERLAPGDMFAQMRLANSVQHAAYFDLKLAGKAGLPNLLTTRDVIRFATRVAARAVGLGDVCGSLEPGKRADIIVLRTDRPNIYPINDPIGAVVWGVDTSNIDLVVVDGRVLMRDGRIEADLDRARRLAVDAQQRVLASAGLLANVTGGDAA